LRRHVGLLGVGDAGLGIADTRGPLEPLRFGHRGLGRILIGLLRVLDRIAARLDPVLGRCDLRLLGLVQFRWPIPSIGVQRIERFFGGQIKDLVGAAREMSEPVQGRFELPHIDTLNTWSHRPERRQLTVKDKHRPTGDFEHDVAPGLDRAPAATSRW